MADVLVRRPLTDDELTLIRQAVNDGEDPAVEAVRMTLDTLLHDLGKCWTEFTEPGSLDPKQYLIPTSQWVEIGGWVQNRQNQLAPSINALLAWMNWGPSSYEEVTDD